MNSKSNKNDNGRATSPGRSQDGFSPELYLLSSRQDSTKPQRRGFAGPQSASDSYPGNVSWSQTDWQWPAHENSTPMYPPISNIGHRNMLETESRMHEHPMAASMRLAYGLDDTSAHQQSRFPPCSSLQRDTTSRPHGPEPSYARPGRPHPDHSADLSPCPSAPAIYPGAARSHRGLADTCVMGRRISPSPPVKSHNAFKQSTPNLPRFAAVLRAVQEPHHE